MFGRGQRRPLAVGRIGQVWGRARCVGPAAELAGASG